MTTRTATLEADLATIPTISGITGRTAVALPPSDLDPNFGVTGGTVYDALTPYDDLTLYFATYLFDVMRVYVGGVLIHRAYDPEMS